MGVGGNWALFITSWGGEIKADPACHCVRFSVLRVIQPCDRSGVERCGSRKKKKKKTLFVGQLLDKICRAPKRVLPGRHRKRYTHGVRLFTVPIMLRRRLLRES